MTDIVDRLVRFNHKIGFNRRVCLSTDLEVEAAIEIDRLRAENEKLRAALAFYADKDTWRSSTSYMCGHIGETRASMDKGEKARAAAAALKEAGDA